MRILIVDDEPDICELAAMLLQPYGKCLTALGGKEAIAILQEHWAKAERIDCIFLDLMMPDMDGFTTLKEIRRLEYERVKLGIDESKIIILTASNNPKDIVSAFKEQSDGYIVKPFDDHKLVAEMKKVGLLS